MPESTELLSLTDPADEAAWRAEVEKGLKGAGWGKLTAKTADGLPIAPLYREPDIATATDVSGVPGAAPFMRGASMPDAVTPWAIRQLFDHPDPARANQDILADLQGGVSSIELRTHHHGGARGVRIERAADLDYVLADVLLDAAPVSLDAGAQGLWMAELLATKLRGASGAGVAFNLDPIGVLMNTGAFSSGDLAKAATFALKLRDEMPAATALRVDARPVHEAGGTEAQETAAALAVGVAYMRALIGAGLSASEASKTLLFTLSVGPDILVETSKLRALRLCWARVSEAFGAAAPARLHAQTSRRMLTRYDSYSNILRTTTAAFAAAIGGAEAITTLPFTDALGLPTPFARRVARNTQHILLEESHAGHVADPAGGSWFVEKLTRDLAEKAWTLFQEIEAKGGIVHSMDWLAGAVHEARAAKFKKIATRREAITGISDFPLLGAALPAFETIIEKQPGPATSFTPIRWSEQFERLRDAMEARTPRPAVFFANLGALAEFSTRAIWTANLFAAGGVGAIGADAAYDSFDASIAAFKQSGAHVALIAGTDAAYIEHAESAAKALKGAGAMWVVMAGKPGEREAALRAAGVDQFVFAGQDAIAELETLHAALK
ncbi:MAG: methylmalonyl-CoA mutase family protein [Hyphomonadaceae bacterium]|nr:methylmalonyl-CoA mutase family protein [Hyphomonadaceae bacterium]